MYQVVLPGTGGCASANGGTILQNGSGVCYYAQTFPQNVQQWGASCNALSSSLTGGIANGSSDYVASSSSASSGQYVAISGAGTSGGTLGAKITGKSTLGPGSISGATGAEFSNIITGATISGPAYPGEGVTGSSYFPAGTIVVSISGSTATLSQQASSACGTSCALPMLTLNGVDLSLSASASSDAPRWYATKADVASSSETFNIGDIVTLTDSTKVVIIAVTGSGTSGTPLNAQVQLQNADTYNPGTTVNDMSGLTSFTMQYKSTGQFWFGNDDSSPIQAAIYAAANPSVTAGAVTPPYIPPGQNVYLPPNAACGITKTIDLPPEGTGTMQTAFPNYLRGYGSGSSGLVALGPAFPLDAKNYSYALLRDSSPPGERGGGPRGLYVEGNLLVTDTCGMQGGQDQIYENVACQDGTHSEWSCGGDTATQQMTGFLFQDILGSYNYLQYPSTATRSTYNFYAGKYCTWSSVVNSKFESAFTAGIEDAQNDWNVYSGNNVSGSQPFNVEYCGEFQNRQHITNQNCDDPVTAAIHVSNVSSPNINLDIQGVNVQWINSLAVNSGVSACGVSIDSGDDYVYVSGLQAVSPHQTFSGSNFICQQGTSGLGAHDIITNNPGSTIAVDNITAPAILPQGRLTFTSGVPVMTGGSSTPYTTLYYAPYVGQQIPITVSGVLQYENFVLPSLSGGMEHVLDSNSSDTNYVQSGKVYDEFVGLNSTTLTLCNGPAWSTSSARSTGLELYNGVLMNAASITCNYNNGAISGTFSCAEDNCTYVGTFYALGTGANPNGQITFNPRPTPVPGGASSVVGIWNYYNRVPIPASEQDTEGTYPANMGGVWEVADAKNTGINNIIVVDGYQQTAFDLQLTQALQDGSTNSPRIAINLAGGCTAAVPLSWGTQTNTSIINVPYNLSALPSLGLRCAQAIEWASTNTILSFNGAPALTMRLNWQY